MTERLTIVRSVGAEVYGLGNPAKLSLVFITLLIGVGIFFGTNFWARAQERQKADKELQAMREVVRKAIEQGAINKHRAQEFDKLLSEKERASAEAKLNTEAAHAERDKIREQVINDIASTGNLSDAELDALLRSIGGEITIP